MYWWWESCTTVLASSTWPLYGDYRSNPLEYWGLLTVCTLVTGFCSRGHHSFSGGGVCCMASIRSVMGRRLRSRTQYNQRCWSLHSSGRPAVPAICAFPVLYSTFCIRAKRCSSLVHVVCIGLVGCSTKYFTAKYFTTKSQSKQTKQNYTRYCWVKKYLMINCTIHLRYLPHSSHTFL